MARETEFRFRQFVLKNEKSPAKVGTDGVVLGAWAGHGIDTIQGRAAMHRGSTILDIGTGTGLIALMMAQRFPETEITAIEIHEPSFLEAKKNIANSKWADRIKIIHSDFSLWAKTCEEKFDLIVSNPPYFSDGTQPQNEADKLWRHSGDLSAEKVFPAVKKLLSPHGVFSVILPYGEDSIWTGAAIKNKLHIHRKRYVFMKRGKHISRMLLEWGLEYKQVEFSEMAVQEEGANQYSEEYIQLTKNFYPWM